jgi:hypothetical protein
VPKLGSCYRPATTKNSTYTLKIINFHDQQPHLIDLGLHTRLHNVIVIINIKTLKS